MNYPKMLYKGNTKHYQHIIANDEEHESLLKEDGYVDFADLELWTGLASSGSVSGGALSGDLPVTTKLGELSKKVVDLELQLSVAQTERDENIAEVEHLNGIIERGKAENIELRQRVEQLTAPADSTTESKPKTTKPKVEQ